MFNSRSPHHSRCHPPTKGQTVPDCTATPTLILTTADAELNIVNSCQRYADGHLKSRA